MRDVIRAIGPASWAVFALCILLLFVLGWCAMTAPGRERSRADAATAKANVEIVVRDAAAKESAAGERLSDAKSNAALKESLNDAVASYPDALPSDRRRALACQRLRNQGTDTASIPACR